MRLWSESEDNVGEEKNVGELFIPLKLFSDRLVTIYGIIYWRIQNSAETNIFFLSAWNNHDWYCLQVFSHRLFWVLIVFGGVALAVFLSTSAYLDWQVVFLIFLLATVYLYLFYLSFNICSFVFVLVLLVFTSVILKLNIMEVSKSLHLCFAGWSNHHKREGESRHPLLELIFSSINNESSLLFCWKCWRISDIIQFAMRAQYFSDHRSSNCLSGVSSHHHLWARHVHRYSR